MSLRIGQLNTTCYFPNRHRGDAEIVDRLARGRFPRDLGEHLGPSLARQPAIVRIRRLPMRVIIPASEFNENALSLKWRQAFAKALFTALAYPTGAGPFEVFRAESVASFVASAIQDLLNGIAVTKWQYAEFEEIFRLGSTQAALALICEWPRHSLAVLLEFAQRAVLDRVLARFDDLAMERLFALLARPPDAETEPLSVAGLIAAAKLALGHLPEKTIALRSRPYALSLFVEGHRTSQPVPSPRALFHALLALAVLLNEEVFWPDREAFWPGIPRGEPWANRLPSNVIAVLETIGRDIRGHMQPFSPMKTPGGPQMLGGTSSPQLAELDRLLTSLRTGLKVPPPSARPTEARWISSEWCGLFFLASTLARLGWIPAWKQLADFHLGGVACLVAGLALAITEKFDIAVPPLDPGIALFAGYLGDPDIAHLRRVFQEFPREVRLRVLHAALPEEAVDEAAETWESTFERLAGSLLRDFASRIRGFRQATRQGIVRSFIARPGRIRIEPEHVVVFPGPSPFHVALHISGMDAPIEAVSWLGGRRLEFELGDL
jgi:hypothetical protein